jgi:hypothetical protein
VFLCHELPSRHGPRPSSSRVIRQKG